jgi:regulator of sigma E protease
MVVLIKIVQVIFALSILVLMHEFGHFLFAKLFKTRVNKFYLFFNPYFSIMRAKKIDGKWRFKFFSKNLSTYEGNNKIDVNTLSQDDWRRYPENTEYGIGWLPLGGYCSIAGMIDESMDKEAMKLPPQPYEFRTKPAWQRFFIMFGGVLFNFILAVLLYGAIMDVWGDEYLRNEDAIYGIAVNDLSYEIGFRDGDRILDFDGVPTENFAMLQVDMVRSQAEEARVLRGNDTLTISIDPQYIEAILNTPGMFDLAFPFVVGGFTEGSINADSGLEIGDEIKGIDSVSMFLAQEIRKELLRHKESTVSATISRNGDLMDIPLQVDSAGMIQVMLDTDLTKFFTITSNEYNFFTAIPAGCKKAWNNITNYVQELGLIFSPKTKAYKSVGSFIAIGKIFPGDWDWYRVWSLTAMLSIMLGVLNLLPIPALDGGHILFLLIEIITRRKPSDKVLEIAQTIGMILLIALMILAFGNDIRGLFT